MDKQWRLVFWALAAIVVILLPALSPAYGQTGDEWLQLLYGRDIWDYFFNGDTQALGYETLLPRYQGMETQFRGQELYGGLFDFGTEVLHRWMPSVPHLVIRHACNALTNAVLMICTGLIARRLSGRWSVGVLALLMILFSPRIFGEGMNNPKDIPFAAGFVLAVYAVLAFLQDGLKGSWRHGVLLMLGFGLAFGVRSAGGLLFFAYLVAMIVLRLMLQPEARKAGWWADKKQRNRILLLIGGALVGGYIIGLLAWPWGLQSPVSNPIASLEGMTNRETKIRTLFEGTYQLNSNMPWYYELKWIFISNPLSVIFGVLLFVLFGIGLRRRYGNFSLLFCLFAALFPLVYMIYKHSSVYDTWRHVFFVYPFWVIMAALGWMYLGNLITEKMAKGGEPKERYIGHGLALLALIPAIIWTVRVHPNQYVYFNEFVGGIRGAEGQYELDYYYNSSRQQVKWLQQQVPRVAGKQTLVLANMGGFGPNCLHNDTAFIATGYLSYYRRATQPWDYYLLFPRLLPEGLVKSKSWLPKNAAHVVSVDGVPLSALVKRTDTSDMAAERALAAKDYVAAANWYAQYVKSNPDDPMALLNYANALAMNNQLPQAVASLQEATKLNPEDYQAWGFLAQVYQAMGNAAAAQDANNRAQSIIAEMQEDSGE